MSDPRGDETPARSAIPTRSMPADRQGATLEAILARIGEHGGVRAKAPERQQRRRLIAQVFQTEFLPKLALTHRTPSADAARPEPGPAVDAAELTRFTRLVLANDRPASSAFIQALVLQACPLARICDDVLAPAARRLGEMWDDDRCSFVEVTAGLGTLHTLLNGLTEVFETGLPAREPMRRLLLASLSGEEHTFGLRMVAEMFRHSGWEVTVEAGLGAADLAEAVRGSWYAVAGLSLADDNHASALALAIRTMRRASANRALGVIVGGPIFIERPELANLVGADLTAPNAEQAVFRAEGLRVLLQTLVESA